MQYDEPLFRPPSEAHSLIIQATLGCSNNTCLFCGMYKMKKFTVRPFDAFKKDVLDCARYAPDARRIFLADGDALVMSMSHFTKILRLLYAKFPNLERVTCYANPLNLLKKSMGELRQLREEGLGTLYLGMESGSEQVLKRIAKGSTRAEILEAGRKALDAGFPLSVTVILGLGGKLLSEEHIRDTASLCSDMNPTYLSALSLMLGPLENYFAKTQGPDFEFLDKLDMLREVRQLVCELHTDNTIFRTNHASNYLPLKGVLRQDRETLLAAIDTAMADPGKYLKPEFLRAL
jgi:radical SAM superfamily enzyme YgiQ (UPF0313 family)